MSLRMILLTGCMILIALAVTACAVVRPDRAANVASGLTSHVLCSQTFGSGQDPDRIYSDVMQVQPGFGLVDWAVSYTVDREKREVSTNIGGLFRSHAIYRDGWGCLLVRGPLPEATPFPADIAAERKTHPALLPEIAGPQVVETADPGLRRALERAFAEDGKEPSHNTKAVVVVHEGKIIAERYAPGYTVDTPIHAWSSSKSVTNALIAILIKQGRLALDKPAPLTPWRAPNDPRGEITLNHLLRQTSGLDLAQTNNGLDPSARMQFIEHDMAGFALAAGPVNTPGTHWGYSDGNYILLSRILRDTVGGSASDVVRFAHRELFMPLGMRNVTMEFDATGTPLGSAFMLAPPRDWARLGLLFLNDGVVGGTRILPEGWVKYSTTPTLETGYGAGFFTNRVSGGQISNWGVGWEMPHAPADTFYGRGYMGQFVIVVPSEHLVVVRMGPSHVWGDDVEGAGQLVADVVAALHAQPGASAAAQK